MRKRPSDDDKRPLYDAHGVTARRPGPLRRGFTTTADYLFRAPFGAGIHKFSTPAESLVHGAVWGAIGAVIFTAVLVLIGAAGR